MKKLFSILAIVALAAGCAHSQVPPPTPPPAVALSCTAPSGFTAGSGNGFIFARAVCTSSTSCPANTSGNTAFTALNITPAATCSFTDANPPQGKLVIYTASTVQAGQTSNPSGPSNGGVPLSVPTLPGAPSGLSGSSQQAMLAPPLQPCLLFCRRD